MSRRRRVPFRLDAFLPSRRPSGPWGWAAAGLALLLALLIAAFVVMGLLFAVSTVVDPRLLGTSFGKVSFP